MITEERKREMLYQLKEYLKTDSFAEFGKRFDLSPQCAHSWFTRGSFDAELIKEKVEEISGDWLLTGEGGMIRKETPKDIGELISALALEQKMLERAQSQSDRLIEILSTMSKSQG